MKGRTMERLTRRTIVGVAGAVLLLGAPVTPVGAYQRPGAVTWVSAPPPGIDGGGASGVAAISSDGRFVAFQSSSSLVQGDTNGEVDVFVHDIRTGTTERASVGDENNEGNGASHAPSISGDGRFVVFHSLASNLVAGDANGELDVFVRDREAGTTELVSVATGGAQANSISYDTAITPDGRIVAFQSFASNLVDGDSNGAVDVFVRDRAAGTTERVSVATGAVEANGGSAVPAISADGRLIAFQSQASNLVPGDANGAWDVFVHDREAGTTERISTATGGVEGDGDSLGPEISADGHHVAFYSRASNLVPGDRNDAEDVFVHDREARITERVSVTVAGAEGDLGSFVPTISADGRLVAYESFATNLVPGDANAETDIFVHEREARTTERVSVAADGGELNGRSMRAGVSADGRLVAFDSYASNLVPGNPEEGVDVYVRDRGPAIGVGSLTAGGPADELSISGWASFSGAVVASSDDPEDDGEDPLGAEIVAASVTYRPELEDVLLRLRLSSLPASVLAGAPGVLYRWALTAGGTAYEIRTLGAAATAVPPAAPYFGLYGCEEICVEISRLSGGIGVTGPEVWVSVPLEALGAEEGEVLAGLEASTALGEATPGPLIALDQIGLPDAPIPRSRVDLGLAPVSSPEEEVTYTTVAALSEGEFSGILDGSSMPGGAHRVWARACLGESCGAESVELGL